MTGELLAAGDLQAPALWRRLACFLYEAVMLFGVGLVAGAAGTVLVAVIGSRHGTAVGGVLQVVGFVVYGVYFTWFWSRSGQTLPMQTWHIRVVTREGAALGRARAAVRYVVSYVWIAPAAIAAHLNGWNRWQALGAVGVGVLAYAALSWLHPQRQFWHDVLCGTRLIDWRPARQDSTRKP